MKRRLLIDSEVLEFVGALRRSDRDLLLARFEAIRNDPARHADFPHRDESGRDLEGHVVGRFAIVFWDNFADRHVKIMGVTWADRMA